MSKLQERAGLALLLLIIGLGSGCQTIPGADVAEPEFIAMAARPSAALPHHLALAPARAQVDGKGQEGFVKAEVARPRRLDVELAAKLRSGGDFEKVASFAPEIVDGAGVRGIDRLAWDEGADLVLETRIVSLETRFDSHNLMWIPNMLIWSYAMVPAWWIPTDRYRLELEAAWTLRLVDRTEPLLESRSRASVVGTFDEFDRGWRWFGAGALLGSGFNGKSNWERITDKLTPAATSMLAQRIAADLHAQAPQVLESERFRLMARREHALVVGLGEYSEGAGRPVRPSVRDGAEQISRILSRRFGDRTVATLLDGSASEGRARRTLARLIRRVRRDDRLTLYFAGRTAGPDLLFHDHDGADAGRLSMVELAAILKTIPGRTQIILDTDFPDVAEPASALFAPLLALDRVAVFVADRPGRARIATPGEPALFTHHLIAALDGGAESGADSDGDGRITMAELTPWVSLRVRSDAGFDRHRQQDPQALGDLSTEAPSPDAPSPDAPAKTAPDPSAKTTPAPSSPASDGGDSASKSAGDSGPSR